jgi:predicted RNase H-related nuclease YkuK (DUF458 family)
MSKSKLTYSEIIEKLKEFYSKEENQNKYSCESGNYDVGTFCKEGTRFIEGIGEVQKVDSYGGEGMGDIYYSVKYFPDHDIYIRVDGYYSSYHGTDFYGGWKCCSEVRPKTVSVVKYELK